MSFLIFLLCGVAGGILGGMGMGGGTLLIPLLTAVCGVKQSAAQGVNLLCFLPMSAVALGVHAKNGLLKKEGLAFLTVPALLFSALASVLAAFLPEAVLSKSFGVFLIVLSFFQFSSAFRTGRERKISKKYQKN